MSSPALCHDLFCRVIDNHGDLGVCWRLARGLAARGQRVRLWVDDPRALDWMAPGVRLQPAGAGDPSEPHVAVYRWPDDDAPPPPLADVVIEAFGCDPPPRVVAAMAASRHAGGSPPVWINLEYLSAEPYALRSHGLRSPQFSGPGAGLDKWFFYPGFDPASGGLMHGDGAAVPAADTHAEVDAAGTRSALVFGYPGASVAAALQALAHRTRVEGPMRLQVPPGGWRAEVQAHVPLGSDAGLAHRGSPAEAAAPAPLPHRAPPDLTWTPMAPVAQPQFDAVLAQSALNLVRGEDSFVRAQLASDAPFLWQIYPQSDGAHGPKLEAFLRLYLADAPDELSARIARAFRAVNGLATWGPPGEPPSWPQAEAWREHQARWRRRLLAQSDLITRLQRFVAERRAEA